jgi:hypothetical protein
MTLLLVSDQEFVSEQDFMAKPAEKVVKGQVQVVEGMNNINTCS